MDSRFKKLIYNPVYTSSFLLLLIGLVVSIVGALASDKAVVSVTYVVIALVSAQLIFLAILILFDLILDYRNVALSFNVFLMSIIYGNINYYFDSNVAALQTLSSGFIIMIVAMVYWTFILGGSTETTLFKLAEGRINTRNTTQVRASNALFRSLSFGKTHSMNQFDAGGILFRAVALYSYAPTDDPSELGFEKGEMLDILDDRGKWWSAKKSDGKSGIVPSNYFKIMED